MEDMATELTNAFGGARGLSLLLKEIVFAPGTRVATKAKIITSIYDYIGKTSKQYGDRAKLHNMDREMIEKRLNELLLKHDKIVPISGVTLHGSPEEKPQREIDDSGKDAVATAQAADRKPRKRK